MKDIKITIEFVGPAGIHNLKCWLCDKEKAVYDMNPTWVFRPCWKCQKLIKTEGQILFKKEPESSLMDKFCRVTLGWIPRAFCVFGLHDWIDCSDAIREDFTPCPFRICFVCDRREDL